MKPRCLTIKSFGNTLQVSVFSVLKDLSVQFARLREGGECRESPITDECKAAFDPVSEGSTTEINADNRFLNVSDRDAVECERCPTKERSDSTGNDVHLYIRNVNIYYCTSH
jgi:hypothetical protein